MWFSCCYCKALLQLFTHGFHVLLSVLAHRHPYCNEFFNCSPCRLVQYCRLAEMKHVSFFCNIVDSTPLHNIPRVTHSILHILLCMYAPVQKAAPSPFPPTFLDYCDIVLFVGSQGRFGPLTPSPLLQCKIVLCSGSEGVFAVIGTHTPTVV